jgi:hypothetical protein
LLSEREKYQGFKQENVNVYLGWVYIGGAIDYIE